jgi:chromate transporter
MAIHIGHRRAGWAGLFVAGTCFIVPAALITLGFAWAYIRFGSLPAAGWLLYGVKPVIVAVVLQALWGLGKTAVKTKLLAGVGVACVVATALGANEVAVLFAAGALVAVTHRLAQPRTPEEPKGSSASAVLPLALVAGGAGATAAAAAPFSLLLLFGFFVKVGAILFGSGYVLLAFLRADLVDRWHWLTEAQLLDAVAVGQVTPGPVFTTATFLGYVLGGLPGAALATLGIFLPAFFFVAVSGPLVPRLRRSPAAGPFLDGVNIASLALMAVVTFQLGRSAVTDGVSGALAIVAAYLLLRFKLNSAWLVLGGGLVGLVTHALR